MNVPAVSVLLPVHNGQAYLRATIDSILAQTCADFELIVLDDGSTDDTARIAAAVTDPRLRFVRHANKGLAATLNDGIELARGQYIARQDHDDLSLPTRFEKQIAFLEANPDHALLGTQAAIWQGDSPTARGHRPAADNASLQFELLFDNPFVHSSVMMRRDAVTALGGYTADPARQPPEDYELWSRLARRHKIANLPEALVIYREVAGSLSRSVSFKNVLVRICSENLAHAAGMSASDGDIRHIAALLHREPAALAGKPDQARMAALIRHIAHGMNQAGPGGDIHIRAERKISRLRRNAWLMPYDRLPPGLRRLIMQARLSLSGGSQA